jgi:uncharacterized FlaG/YvyC family protein
LSGELTGESQRRQKRQGGNTSGKKNEIGTRSSRETRSGLSHGENQIGANQRRQIWNDNHRIKMLEQIKLGRKPMNKNQKILLHKKLNKFHIQITEVTACPPSLI